MVNSTATDNHGMQKPGQDDFYDIDVFNANMDIVDAALVSYGVDEPPGGSYVWFQVMHTTLIADDRPNKMILQLSGDTGNGYYLNTEQGSQRITNMTESIQDAQEGDIIISV